MLNDVPSRTVFKPELERLEVFEALLPVAVPDIYPGQCCAIISDGCRAARCCGQIHRGCVLLLRLFLSWFLFTTSASSIIYSISVKLTWPFLMWNWWVVEIVYLCLLLPQVSGGYYETFRVETELLFSCFLTFKRNNYTNHFAKRWKTRTVLSSVLPPDSPPAPVTSRLLSFSSVLSLTVGEP